MKLRDSILKLIVLLLIFELGFIFGNLKAQNIDFCLQNNYESKIILFSFIKINAYRYGSIILVENNEYVWVTTGNVKGKSSVRYSGGTYEEMKNMVKLYEFRKLKIILYKSKNHSGAFSIDQISGGVRTLHAINNGVFDPNKEYKYAKGKLMEINNNLGVVYDIASIGVDIASFSKSLNKIKGSEINKFLKSAEKASMGLQIVGSGKNIKE